MSQFDEVPMDELEGEILEVKYIPVSQVILWDMNPKQHAIDSLIESIQKNGFRDPPSFDATLGALIEGNGRATALGEMCRNDYEVPRAILVHKETGEWYMPVNFGVNSATRNAAVAYAIDHNNLTMAGGDFTVFDYLRMWNTDEMTGLLEGLDAEDMPVTIDVDDLSIIMDDGFEFGEDLDTYNEEEPDDADPFAPRVITVQVIEHGIVDDVVDAIDALVKENAWERVITVEPPPN